MEEEVEQEGTQRVGDVHEAGAPQLQDFASLEWVVCVQEHLLFQYPGFVRLTG